LNDAMKKLQEDNPELATTIGTMFDAHGKAVDAAVDAKLNPIQKGMEQVNFSQQVDRSQQEIHRMRADSENYPLFDQVWTDMAKMLQKNRVSGLHDAYTLAVAGTVPLNRIAAKSSANMIEGTQGGLKKTVTDKIYKSPREAAEAAMEGRWGTIDDS